MDNILTMLRQSCLLISGFVSLICVVFHSSAVVSPNDGRVSWGLVGGGGALEDLTSLIILSSVSEYLHGERERKEEEEGERGRQESRLLHILTQQ